jgi:asparagine synthase (glutamine-hydrolysing)
MIRVAGDVRLEREEELAKALAAPDERGLVLVARAFERWGAGCLSRLQGDFAFVALDRSAGSVVVARDRFGVRPLAYRVLPDALAIASDPAPLAALADVVVDDEAVREFLEGEEHDATLTFFRGVRRLPAGHALSFGGDVTRWFHPPARERRSSSDETLDGFRDRFRAAVETRVARGPVLVQLSGGLDSSSIACVADVLLAPQRSSVTLASAAFRGADERRYVDAVAARVSLPLVKFDAKPSPELDDPLDPNHPARYPLAAMTTKLVALARERGARALVSGTGGDELVFERGAFRDLAARGRFVRLLRETPRYSTRSRAFYLRDALASLVPERLRGVVRAIRARRGAVAQAPARPAWMRAPERSAPPPPPAPAPPVARFHSETTRFTWEWLTGPRLSATLEAEDRAAARADLEMRYPFLDAELATYVLATPYEHRLPERRMKSLLRDALADALPPLVRDRATPTTFDADIADAVAAKLDHVRSAIEVGPWLSDRWVDRPAAKALLARFRADTADFALAGPVWDIAMLELWLRAL